MGWEAVPWAIGGGAVISDHVLRTLAYAASDGNDGILGFPDLKVTATGTPGPSVDVAPGAAVLPVRTPNHPYQAYVGRCPTADNVSIAATGAGAGRTDMVVAQVEDPYLTGEPWADPADPAIGPYMFTRVIQGVPSSAIASRAAARAHLASIARSAIPLAGITLPLSTATVLQSHINDLRSVANARRETRKVTYNPSSTFGLTSASEVEWFALPGSVEIPAWATQVAVGVQIHGAAVQRFSTTVNGAAYGNIRARLGTSAPGPVSTQTSSYDFDAPFQSGTTRYTVGAGDTVAIPAGYRGTTQSLSIRGLRTGGNKNLLVDTASAVVVDLEFLEGAV